MRCSSSSSSRRMTTSLLIACSPWRSGWGSGHKLYRSMGYYAGTLDPQRTTSKLHQRNADSLSKLGSIKAMQSRSHHPDLDQAFAQCVADIRQQLGKRKAALSCLFISSSHAKSLQERYASHQPLEYPKGWTSSVIGCVTRGLPNEERMLGDGKKNEQQFVSIVSFLETSHEGQKAAAKMVPFHILSSSLPSLPGVDYAELVLESQPHFLVISKKRFFPRTLLKRLDAAFSPKTAKVVAAADDPSILLFATEGGSAGEGQKLEIVDDFGVGAAIYGPRLDIEAFCRIALRALGNVGFSSYSFGEAAASALFPVKDYASWSVKEYKSPSSASASENENQDPLNRFPCYSSVNAGLKAGSKVGGAHLIKLPIVPFPGHSYHILTHEPKDRLAIHDSLANGTPLILSCSQGGSSVAALCKVTNIGFVLADGRAQVTVQAIQRLEVQCTKLKADSFGVVEAEALPLLDIGGSGTTIASIRLAAARALELFLAKTTTPTSTTKDNRSSEVQNLRDAAVRDPEHFSLWLAGEASRRAYLSLGDQRQWLESSSTLERLKSLIAHLEAVPWSSCKTLLVDDEKDGSGDEDKGEMTLSSVVP